MLRKVGRINSPRDFDKLVAGFKRMRGVTYVGTTEDILHPFDQGLESMELILGYRFEDSAEDAVRNGLRKNTTALDRLLSLYQSGRFLALVPRPKRREHSKYYIFENDETIRFVFTSYNLSGSRQGNIFIQLDFPRSQPDDYRDLVALYESIREDCSEFPDLRKLAEHVGDETGEERARAIQVWITAESELDEGEEEKDAVSMTIADIVRQALAKVRDAAGDVPTESLDITVVLPDDPEVQRKILDAANANGWKPTRSSTTEVTFDAGRVAAAAGILSKKKEIVFWPSAWIRRDGHLVVGFHGEPRDRTVDQMDPEDIRSGLRGVERYIETVDRGQARPEVKDRVKANMGETLLFLFASPFFNEYYRRKRSVYHQDRIGPPDLTVTGGASNGKTRFVEYCLKLMVGEYVPLLNAPDFLTRALVRNAIRRVGSFPLVFDEVHGRALLSRDMEALVKSVWEAWSGSRPEFRDVPALVFVGNEIERKDSIARRMKFLEYDIHYAKTDENETLVGSIFEEPNDLYRYFTRQYVQEDAEEARNGTVSLVDALRTARSTIRSLYAIAGLGEPPGYFVERPVEEVYDVGVERWVQAIEHGQIELIGPGTEANPWFADFKSGMEKQIGEYRGFLVGVKNRREGNRLILEHRETFSRWIGRGDEKAGVAKLLDAVARAHRDQKLRGKPPGFWSRFGRGRRRGT